MRAHYVFGLTQHMSWVAGQAVGAASEMLGKRALAWDTPAAGAQPWRKKVRGKHAKKAFTARPSHFWPAGCFVTVKLTANVSVMNLRKF